MDRYTFLHDLIHVPLSVGRWYHWRIVRSCGDRLVSMLAGLHPVDGLLDFAVHIPNAGDANPNRFKMEAAVPGRRMF